MSGGGEEAQERQKDMSGGRVTTTHIHAQVHNVQPFPSPTACTSTPWGNNSNRRGFRYVHDMDERAADNQVCG